MSRNINRLPETYVEGFHDLVAVKAMKYSRFGNTDMFVSNISFGGGPLGGLYGEFDEADAIKSVQLAIQKGINYIDTAPWYGNGRSEALLGKALADVPREAYYIATKVGRYKPDIEHMFDFSAEKALSSVEESLKLLGLKYVDVIQVHDVEFAPCPEIIVKETLPALETLVKAGKCKYIGLTGYSLHALKEILDMNEEINKPPIPIRTVLGYTRCTYFDDFLVQCIRFYESVGCAVLNASLCGMGLLTNGGPPDWHPAGEEIKTACAKAREHCKQAGVELGRCAVYYALNEVEGPRTHLVGINSTATLMSNLGIAIGEKAGEGAEVFTPKEKQINNEVKEKFFKDLTIHNWEGVEVNKYWSVMEKLGIPKEKLALKVKQFPRE